MKKLIPTILIMLLSFTAVAQQKPYAYKANVRVSELTGDIARLIPEGTKTTLKANTKGYERMVVGESYFIGFVVIKDDTPPTINLLSVSKTLGHHQKYMNGTIEQLRETYNIIPFNSLKHLEK